ncbi:hypothetical protein ABIB50_003841 [Mucilaginibacter sp. UYCu711]
MEAKVSFVVIKLIINGFLIIVVNKLLNSYKVEMANVNACQFELFKRFISSAN